MKNRRVSFAARVLPPRLSPANGKALGPGLGDAALFISANRASTPPGSPPGSCSRGTGGVEPDPPAPPTSAPPGKHPYLAARRAASAARGPSSRSSATPASSTRTMRAPPGPAPSARTMHEMHECNGIEFSPREPAVNVHGRGGEFAPHEDHQARAPL